MNDRQLKELILAAKGKLPFDIYFYNARIVAVSYTHLTLPTNSRV